MRLVVKEKFLSISGKYYIKDREGNDVFLVKGAFSIPKKYRIYDMAGREIVMIKNTLFVPKLIAHIKFYENNKLILIAKRKFSIKAKYDINGSAGNYSINGNIFDHDFEIKQGETVIASIFKKMTIYRDSYMLDIEDESKLPIILGLSVMLDYVHHRHNDDNY